MMDVTIFELAAVATIYLAVKAVEVHVVVNIVKRNGKPKWIYDRIKKRWDEK